MITKYTETPNIPQFSYWTCCRDDACLLRLFGANASDVNNDDVIHSVVNTMT